MSDGITTDKQDVIEVPSPELPHESLMGEDASRLETPATQEAFPPEGNSETI